MRSTPLRDSRARLAAALLLAVASVLLPLGLPGIEVGQSGANLSDTETVGAGSLVTRACTTPSSYATAVAALKPTFYWQLSDAPGSTTVADSSGNGNPGTVVSGSPTVTLGAASSGLVRCDDTGLTSPSIPGTSTGGSFVVKPTPDQTRNTFTTMAWVSTQSTTGGRILGQGDSATGESGNSDRMLFLDNAGHVVFGVYSNNQVHYLRSSAAVNNGLPHFLAASLGKAGATLYVDGVRDQLDTTVTKADTYPKNQGYWRVGWDNLNGWGAVQPTDFGLSGVIAEAAVFQGTQLTDAQIAGLWAANHW
jgi:hypothetical protein